MFNKRLSFLRRRKNSRELSSAQLPVLTSSGTELPPRYSVAELLADPSPPSFTSPYPDEPLNHPNLSDLPAGVAVPELVAGEPASFIPIVETVEEPRRHSRLRTVVTVVGVCIVVAGVVAAVVAFPLLVIPLPLLLPLLPLAFN